MRPGLKCFCGPRFERTQSEQRTIGPILTGAEAETQGLSTLPGFRIEEAGLRSRLQGVEIEMTSLRLMTPVQITWRQGRRIYAGILRKLWSARAGRVL